MILSVFYDEYTNAIWVSNRKEPFMSRSLVAERDGDKITIRTRFVVNEIVNTSYDIIRDAKGNAFPDAEATLAYLNGQFSMRRPSFYMHQQVDPQNLWLITHNLGFFPNVSVRDSAGDLVISDVIWPDANTAIVSFAQAQSGLAYLS